MAGEEIQVFRSASVGTMIKVGEVGGRALLTALEVAGVGVAGPEIAAALAAGAIVAGTCYLIQKSNGEVLDQPIPVTREMAPELAKTQWTHNGKDHNPFHDRSFVNQLPTQEQAKVEHKLNLGSVHNLDENDANYPYKPSQETPEGKLVMAHFKYCDPGMTDFQKFGDLKKNPHMNRMLQEAPQHRNPEGKVDTWQVHHLVEQNQNSRFGSEAIQNSSNVIMIPESLHKEITRYYSSKPFPESPEEKYIKDHPGVKSTNRSYVQSLPYDKQRSYGIKILKRAMNEVPLNSQARDYINTQLNRIEKTQQSFDKKECLEASLLRGARAYFPERVAKVMKELEESRRMREEMQNRQRQRGRDFGMELG